MADTNEHNMLSLTIDQQSVRAPAGTTILQAAQGLGIDIPHFCYHPKLSLDGNCRLCAVEVEGRPDPVISCKEPVAEGMIVHTRSALAVEARKAVLEFTLANHPLDCPVCDCAGECKLQEYYVAHSCRPSRFTEHKIAKPKMVDAGPYVVLDAERCVGCRRCERFCDEIVGSHEIGMTERGCEQLITAARTLTNPYSLCTVDLCPVGALTSKDFRFAKRTWFLKSGLSICTGCAAGCNTWVDHEGDVVYRVRPRENDAVNGPWMCDDGRMTYKRLHSDARLITSKLLTDGAYRDTSWGEALAAAASHIKAVEPGKAACVLSAHATLEENAALYALFCRLLSFGHVLMTGEERNESFADDILRDADQNPNARGAELFTTGRLRGAQGIELLVVLGSLAEAELTEVAAAKPAHTIAIATHEPALPAFDVLLPLAPIEEQEGTLINRQGRLQRAQQAYPPRGQSKPGWAIVAELARAIDKPMDIPSARDAFERARAHAGALKDIAYDDVGETGVLLP